MKGRTDVPLSIVTDEDLRRVWTVPKDCSLSLEELLDEGRAVLSEGHGEVNRRWKKELSPEGI